MTYLNYRFPVCLLLFLAQAQEVSASSWTCQQGELTRQVVVFYPEAPAQLPCEVFYAKPTENILPRALWKATNKQNYCEHKAAEFVDKLRSMGWNCSSDDPEEANSRNGTQDDDGESKQ